MNYKNAAQNLRSLAEQIATFVPTRPTSQGNNYGAVIMGNVNNHGGVNISGGSVDSVVISGNGNVFGGENVVINNGVRTVTPLYAEALIEEADVLMTTILTQLSNKMDTYNFERRIVKFELAANKSNGLCAYRLLLAIEELEKLVELV